MRLARFIVENMPEILSEWDAFARTLDLSSPMTALALRDHAKPILEAIAQDMDTPETSRQQMDKSRGLDPVDINSAASTHGTLRHVSGFSLGQLAAEYRALRATVLRLWLPRVAEFNAEVAGDMVRFNETIDQALAESVLTFSDQGQRTRDTFLAILGHDLRSPLATISWAAEVLGKQTPGPTDIRAISVRLRRSAVTMSTMVNDLLEFARVQLGGLIPITTVALDALEVCTGAIEDARAANPGCSFELAAAGDLNCSADRIRLQQVLSNLLNNAAQYSPPGCAVRLIAQGTPDALTIEVANSGSVIPAAAIGSIFEPLIQLSDDRAGRGRPTTSMGLGLYIAREIMVAHGGTVHVSSNEESGTVFTVRLPKGAALQELGRVTAEAYR